MLEIIFETLRFLIMGGILVFLIWIGVSRNLLGNRAWIYSFAAFTMILVGTLIDVIDDYQYTTELFNWRESVLTIALEKGVGSLGGFAFLFLAALNWLPQAEKLAVGKAKAEASSKAKSRFVANMSHELRTPLNSIIGFSEIISEQSFGPVGNAKYSEYANDINQSGQHLLGVINDMLDLSKVESGTMELNRDEFELEALVYQCTKMMTTASDAKGLSMVVAIEDVIPKINADELRIRQIVLNILSNAVKFTDNGGTIATKLNSLANGGVSLSIEDTGVGIAEKNIAVALAPFGQVNHGKNTTQPGTGLGLPLAEKMLEAHGGSLEIVSTLGIGTEVVLNFPAELFRT